MPFVPADGESSSMSHKEIEAQKSNTDSQRRRLEQLRENVRLATSVRDLSGAQTSGLFGSPVQPLLFSGCTDMTTSTANTGFGTSGFGVTSFGFGATSSTLPVNSTNTTTHPLDTRTLGKPAGAAMPPSFGSSNTMQSPRTGFGINIQTPSGFFGGGMFGSSPFGSSLFGAQPSLSDTGVTAITANTVEKPSLFGSASTMQSPHTGSSFGGKPFGTPPSGAQPSLYSSTNVTAITANTAATLPSFGSANTMQSPCTGFGLNSTTSSFSFCSVPPNQTEIQKAVVQPPQQTAPSLFAPSEKPAAAISFGQITSFASSDIVAGMTGTLVKFRPLLGSDTIMMGGRTRTISTRHYCITCMKAYEGKSFEELRWEYYTAGRHRQSPGARTSGVFGSPAQPSVFSDTGVTTITANTGFGSAVLGCGATSQPTTASSLSAIAMFGSGVTAATSRTLPVTSTTTACSTSPVLGLTEPAFTSRTLPVTSTTTAYTTSPILGLTEPAFTSRTLPVTSTTTAYTTSPILGLTEPAFTSRTLPVTSTTTACTTSPILGFRELAITSRTLSVTSTTTACTTSPILGLTEPAFTSRTLPVTSTSTTCTTSPILGLTEPASTSRTLSVTSTTTACTTSPILGFREPAFTSRTLPVTSTSTTSTTSPLFGFEVTAATSSNLPVNATTTTTHRSDTRTGVIQEEAINVEHSVVFPRLPEDTEMLTVYISRNHCVDDLINLYRDEQIVNKKLHVTFLGEKGIDAGGLTKELFNIFFRKSEGIFFRGEDCLVPYLELNKMNEQDKFVSIGRILQHMLLLTKTIPSKLSRLTLMLIAHPEKDIDSDILLKELSSYVNPYLRTILKKAEKSFASLTEKEKETVQDFFQSNRFFAIPSSEIFSEQLKIIATEILVEKPRRLIAKIRQGVSPEKYANFWYNCNFSVLLDMQTPTATKLVNCLVTNPYLTNEENDVLHYFTMYIHCLDNDRLAKLVFLITGSFLMPTSIHVKFNNTVGLSQRPIFSTCIDAITLPRTYTSYNDLKNDLNMCLNTEEVQEYTSY